MRKKYYILNEMGEIQYIGLFREGLQEADEYLEKNKIVSNWLFGEETAKHWLTTLNKLLNVKIKLPF